MGGTSGSACRADSTPGELSNMSDTWKPGKRERKWPMKRPFNLLAAHLRHKRIIWGSTERILRRNHKLWDRLMSKARRAHDSEIIKESLEETEE